MLELTAKSISLYLEGLMILTFNKNDKTLEAAMLSEVGHTLKGIIHRRESSSEWEPVLDDPFDFKEVRECATGQIFINYKSADVLLSKNYTTINGEKWEPFRKIPNLEKEILGEAVDLDSTCLKPCMRIKQGKFFSVPDPQHPAHPKHQFSAKQNKAAASIESFLVEVAPLQGLQNISPTNIDAATLKQILGTADRNLGIKTYTAATQLELNEGQELIIRLDKTGPPETGEILKITYDSNYDIRMLIGNFPAMNHSGHTSNYSIEEYFHSFHFYHAVKPITEKIERKFALGSIETQVAFVKKAKHLILTGGGNPDCPIGWREE